MFKKNIFLVIFFGSFYLDAQPDIQPNEISYGYDEKQKIDFYKGSSDKVLIWIHGGGWLFGDKRAERWIKRFQNHFINHKELNIYMIATGLARQQHQMRLTM